MRKTLVDHLDGWSHGGIRVEIRHGDPYASSSQLARVIGDLVSSAGRAGSFSGSVSPGNVSGYEAKLCDIEVDEAERGQGFARSLLADLEPLLAQVGVQQLKVRANGPGAYVFASCGFEFAVTDGTPAEAARNVVERSEWLKGPEVARHNSTVRSLLERVEGSDARSQVTPPLPSLITSPQGFLDFVDEAAGADRDERETVVKEVLGASAWSGVKVIGPAG